MIINMAADRAVYIDQSQSLNIHIAEPNYAKLTSMHFHAWKKVKTIDQTLCVHDSSVCMFCFDFCVQGLKTGMYYLRTKPATQAIQFTVDKSKLTSKAETKSKEEDNMAAIVCSIDNKDACVMCSG